jgi:hypothetical protein
MVNGPKVAHGFGPMAQPSTTVGLVGPASSALARGVGAPPTLAIDPTVCRPCHCCSSVTLAPTPTHSSPCPFAQEPDQRNQPIASFLASTIDVPQSTPNPSLCHVPAPTKNQNESTPLPRCSLAIAHRRRHPKLDEFPLFAAMGE